MVCEFVNGALGTLSITGAGGSTWSSFIEIIGKRGVAAFDINFPNRLHRLALCDAEAVQSLRNRVAAIQTRRIDGAPAAASYYGSTHRDQVAAFFDCIRGGPWRGCTVREALSTVELIWAMYEASRSGRWIDTPALASMTLPVATA